MSLIAAAAFLFIGFLGGKPVAAASIPAVSSVATVNYVPGYGIAVWQRPGQQLTGKYLADGTRWRVFASTYVNGRYWYNLGGNQWIDGKYLKLGVVNGGTGGAAVNFLGLTTPIIEGDRSIVDAPPANIAQTWGGATHLAVNDGLSTHLVAHDGASNFDSVKRLKVGDAVTVLDSQSQEKTYRVYRVADVDDYGNDQATGQNLWSAIVDANQGEQIVLQTCISDTINRIVWAH
ncbi:hypothetical protein FC34_GL000593 [Lacticaseibacillus brantae DSM 23927]|uniref:Sortase n=2 Tax=Lacticaseibacillus brantae TaxID=943673 RepID=A0A0R2AZW9_9LACO|nr:hypothetical protein FC34_GL000593 [Lacticaseibacillus brantae DSM 23927]